jgi:mevalonate kinase
MIAIQQVRVVQARRPTVLLTVALSIASIISVSELENGAAMSATSATLTLTSQDQERIQKAIEELKRRGLYDKCPRCGTNDWLVELAAILTSPLPPPGRGVGVGSFAPVVVLTCKNCAAMFNHNLITLGLWP